MERGHYTPDEIESRYNRHAAFLSSEQEEANEKQEKLHSARVALLGCGAGSSLAPHLARMGVSTKGEMVLADPDTVDVTNLNRQDYHESQLGTNKAVALQERVKEINSSVKTNVLTEGVTLENLSALVRNSDVIVDMIDVSVPEIMFALHDEAKEQKKPVITGLDVGEGIISYVFDYRNEESMSMKEFIGMPETASIEDIKQIPSFSLASQFIIGSTDKVFENQEEAIEYYNNFFETQGEKLMDSLPPEAHDVMPRIVTGELDHIPQSNAAATLLGATHAQLVKEIILDNPVRTAPDSIRMNILESIRP